MDVQLTTLKYIEPGETFAGKRFHERAIFVQFDNGRYAALTRELLPEVVEHGLEAVAAAINEAYQAKGATPEFVAALVRLAEQEQDHWFAGHAPGISAAFSFTLSDS